jgi:hypothetical protein
MVPMTTRKPRTLPHPLASCASPTLARRLAWLPPNCECHIIHISTTKCRVGPLPLQLTDVRGAAHLHRSSGIFETAPRKTPGTGASLSCPVYPMTVSG